MHDRQIITYVGPTLALYAEIKIKIEDDNCEAEQDFFRRIRDCGANVTWYDVDGEPQYMLIECNKASAQRVESLPEFLRARLATPADYEIPYLANKILEEDLERWEQDGRKVGEDPLSRLVKKLEEEWRTKNRVIEGIFYAHLQNTAPPNLG